jgi:hypothetical protein
MHFQVGRRNAGPGAPDISNGHDNGKKAYQETCLVCEQLSEKMIEWEDLVVTRNRPKLLISRR